MLDDSNSEKKANKKLKDKTSVSTSSPSSSSTSSGSLNNKLKKTNKLNNDLYDDDSIQAADSSSNNEIKTVDVNINSSSSIKEQTIVQKEEPLVECQLSSTSIKQETEQQPLMPPETLPKPSSSSSSIVSLTGSQHVTAENKNSKPGLSLADSKLNLLLKSNDSETLPITVNKGNAEQQQQLNETQKESQTQIIAADKNKEIAAHLLADLSYYKIENKDDTQPIDSKSQCLDSIFLSISPSSAFKFTPQSNAVVPPQINDLLSTKPTIDSSPAQKKTKKNISSLLESPIKSSAKISTLISTTATVTPSTLSETVINDEMEKKAKKTKLKRKSFDSTTANNNDASPDEKAKHQISSASKMNAKRRKQQSTTASGELNKSPSVDIFGNRLNSLEHLPAGCASDFEMLEEHQQQTQAESDSKPKTSTISSILNKKESTIVGPPKPITQSQYKILNDEQTDTNELVNYFKKLIRLKKKPIIFIACKISFQRH